MWYEDEALVNLSIQHDGAIDNKNVTEMEALIENSLKNANDVELHPMIRAQHFYNCATTIRERDYLLVLGAKDREESIEKTLFLFRESITLQEDYFSKEIEEGSIDEVYWEGLYNSTIVNYSNLLSNVGRIPSAIQEIRKVAVTGFSMAVGNLGGYLKHYLQLDYDTGHKNFFLYEMLLLLKFVTENKDSSLYPQALEMFQKELDDGLKLFDGVTIQSLDFNDILLFREYEKMDWHDICIDSEKRYQNWKVSNSLTLNTLNDYDISNIRDNDVLHLPSMIRPIAEKQPIFSGLFNQIKQEFCSARYFIFDGIYNKKTHFSDGEVYLVNLHDYPVYGINIEKIKAGYRAIYSLFDRIAYFLNEYYELGIPRRSVNFKNIWNANTKKEKIKRESNDINKLLDAKYLLNSLYWIKKDLYNETKSGYTGNINTKLNKANKIRNTMEHKYLKIVDDTFISSERVDDELADLIIERSEFEELSIELLKVVREAIIVLTQVIYLEESREDGSHVLPIRTSEYNDDWKF